MLRRISKKKIKTIQDEGIHIVGLWNLMVILIPFLLLSAFVSQTAILNLYIPTAKPDLSIGTEGGPLVIVSISKAGFKIQKEMQILSPIPMKEDQYDFIALTDILYSIKQEYPDQEHIIILSDPMIPYETLIQVMDTAREKVVLENGIRKVVPLFPQISIGEEGGRLASP